MGKKFCPSCGSEDVMMVAGGVTGSWMCKNCGFSGSIFPEKELLGRDESKMIAKEIKGKKVKKEKGARE